MVLPFRRLLALEHGIDHIGYTARLEPFVPLLAGAGVAVEVRDYPSLLRGMRALLRTLDDGTILFIHRHRYGPIPLYLIRRRARRIVYEIDDAIMYNSSRHGKAESPSRRRAFARMARAADRVIVTNEFLRGEAARYTERLTVIPTTIDPAPYLAEPRPAPVPGRVRVGWMGTPGGFPYLRAIGPALAAAARRVPGLEVTVCSREPCAIEGLETAFVPWTLATQTASMATFDVGLTPLADDPWSRGKYPVKTLYYMALGVPVVASAVGSNLEAVRDGETGFLASTNAGWEESIVRLATDAGLRSRLGAAARAKVLAENVPAVVFPRFFEAVTGAPLAEVGR